MQPQPKGHKQILGRSGEVNVCSLLRRAGRRANVVKHRRPYDLLVDGWKIDVKTAKPHLNYCNGNVPTWMFRIHSNYKMREHETDFYVFRFEQVPYFRQPIHLLVKSPIQKPFVAVSLRQLIIQWAHLANDFRRFRAGKFGVKQPALESVNAA
jgi:hypothetical protein